MNLPRLAGGVNRVAAGGDCATAGIKPASKGRVGEDAANYIKDTLGTGEVHCGWVAFCEGHMPNVHCGAREMCYWWPY